MAYKGIKKDPTVGTVLRGMREAASLTMRQAAGMVGISHVSISQLENGKLSLPEFRIEQLVETYGLGMDDFYKLMGRKQIGYPRDQCIAMVKRLSDRQLSVVKTLLKELLRDDSRIAGGDHERAN
jgi:transcriptional regulator with XRE-family HTH domain